RTGVHPPDWDFSLLRESAAAFGILIDAHYRFYQWSANTLVSLAVVCAARRLSLGLSAPLGWPDFGFLFLTVVLFLGSRDALAKYYHRTGQALPGGEGGDWHWGGRGGG